MKKQNNMTQTTQGFLRTLLEKMGVDSAKQDEIIKTFTNTLMVTTIGVLSKSVPEEKQKELGKKLESADNWIETLTKEAMQLGEKESIVKELNSQLKNKINEFLDFLTTECPEDKKEAVLEYVNSFTK